MSEVYLSLGGNIGDSAAILNSAMRHIAALESVFDFKASRFYRTSPVSDLPQNAYVNAACSFSTAMDARTLFSNLQKIETLFGKIPKQKNAPRIIDIDIVLFGLECHRTPELEIPHPRWKERLFVIQPLSDLVRFIFVPCDLGTVEWLDITEMKRTFINSHHETVSLLDEAEGDFLHVCY